MSGPKPWQPDQQLPHAPESDGQPGKLNVDWLPPVTVPAAEGQSEGSLTASNEVSQQPTSSTPKTNATPANGLASAVTPQADGSLHFPPPNVVPGPPGGAQAQRDIRLQAPSLPVVLTQYQDFWRTPRWQIWRSIVAIVLFIIFWLAESTLVVGVYLVASGGVSGLEQSGSLDSEELLKMTPGMFLANNISLALMIPLAFLVALILFDQRPKWLSSVVGGIRWGWLGRCLGVLAGIWVIYNGIIWLLNPETYQGMEMQPYTWFMIFSVLLTTPLQAAGEEYGFRGVINRAMSSFVQPDVKFGPVPVGWLLGGVVSSAMFMAVHGAADPWLNLFYFSFGMAACYLTWRTGGLEAAVAMHVVNNMLAMIPLPFVDFSDLFDRSAGKGDWTVLIGIAACVIGALVVDRMAAKHGIVRENAPAAQSQSVVQSGESQPPSVDNSVS